MKRILLILLFLILSVRLAGADNSNVKAAIIKKDYKLANKLANEILDFAVVEKGLANETRYFLGVSQLNLQEYEPAIDNFKQVLKSKPSIQLRDKAYLGLFDGLYLTGDYKGAQKAIKKIGKVSPKSEFLSLIYLKRAKVSLKLARWKQAKVYLNKIIEQFPNSYEFFIAKQLLDEEQFFAVQIGAFMNQDKAEKLMFELKQKNEYAYIVETTDRENRKFYRVRVGQITKINDAQNLKVKLSQEGYPAKIYP